MTEFILVATTSDKRDVLENICQALVERHLAACCQIQGPITSIFRWEGSVQTSEEWKAEIKTLSSRYEEVESLIRAKHDYDTPEIIVTRIAGGDQQYLDWFRAGVD